MNIKNQEKTKHEEIDRLLDVRLKAFARTGPKTFWPANGAQLYSYFADAEAWDLLQKIKQIRKDDIPLQKIAKLFSASTTIRYYIGSNAVRGLKIRKKYVGGITQQDKLDFMNFFFELLRNMRAGDIFCSNDKNKILKLTELSNLIVRSKWNKANDSAQKAIATLIISALALVWALYYDIFVGNGLENHGPYDVSKQFEQGSVLIVRDYFNVKPIELWKHCTNFKYKSIKIYTIYKQLDDVGIDYFSHILSKSSLRNKLSHFCVLVDGEEVSDIGKIIQLAEELSLLASKQTHLVNGLSVQDKIKKGAESSYYGFKKFREFFGEDWKPGKIVDRALNEFGLEFWNKFKTPKEVSPAFLRKLLDPRNDFLG